MKPLAKPPSREWIDFYLCFDPAGLLTPRQQGVIRQLYQVLRQSGYQLSPLGPKRPAKRARLE